MMVENGHEEPKSVFILDKYLISNFTKIVQDPDLAVLEGMDQLLHRNFTVHFKVQCFEACCCERLAANSPANY
jgi:hypothetical protein